ncbi:hypothetical protein BGX38DRAFT_425686 [Terfezia claveryi]|nr:hypothetical protein BGX38DRAFT_425686 [Terfezia claveryi]
MVDEVKVGVEAAVQTVEEIKKRGASERRGASESEDVVMADRSDMYEDLSGYEGEDKDEAPVVAPPTTKKQAVPRPAAKAGKKSRQVKIPPQNTPPSNNSSAKAIVIHGVPCQRSMADIIQDMGVRGILGARWLLGGNRRLGKATSSVVVFFDRKLAIGSHLRMRGWWLPIEAYEFDRGRKRVDLRSDR